MADGLAVAEAAGKGFDPVGTIVNAIITYYGIKQQAKENERTRTANLGMFNQQMDESKRQFGVTTGLQKSQLAFQRQKFGKELAFQKEARNFNRASSVVNNLTSLFNSNDQVRTGLVNLWRNK